MHDLAEVWPHAANDRMSSLPAPMLISDSLADVRNMADGKIYDSKSAYYKAVKAAGCEVIGNDRPKSRPEYQPDSKSIAADVAQTMKQKGLML